MERFAIIPGCTLRTVTYPPPRLATMGVKLSLPRLFTNTYIRVIDTHTYMYIYARVENARVFITARYRPNIIFAARASTATSLVLCLSALVALTRATLTSPRTLTYLLTSPEKSISLSRNLGVDVPLIFRADYRGKRAPGQFSVGGEGEGGF